MKETEYKFLVAKDKFYEIMNAVKEKYPDVAVNERVQINYYYDTNDGYLRENSTTLRVRQIEDNITLELKESVITDEDFSTSNETSGAIETLTDTIILSDGKYAGISFPLQGNLVTRRLSLRPTADFSIDFDVNCYFGCCDYEIEIEFAENASKEVSGLAESLELMQYKNQTGGKSRRFFTCKKAFFKE